MCACVCMCTLLTSFSRRRLNRFEQSWTHSKGIIGALNKCKRIMAATSGYGVITGNVVFRPTSTELTSFSRRWLNRFGQFRARLKAELRLRIKCKWIMTAASGSGDITGNVVFRPTFIKLTSVSRRWLNRFGQL